MLLNAHRTQHRAMQLQHVQWAVANSRSAAGSRNHHHKRSQVAKTHREKLQNCQQSTDFIARSSSTSRICRAILVPHLRRDIDKIEKVQRKATKMSPEIRNHTYHQRIQDLDIISIVQRRLRGQLIEVFIYLIRFTNKLNT